MLAITQPSLLDLRNWLESKDPNESYNYHEPSHCLLAQYSKDRELTYHVPFIAGKPPVDGPIDKVLEYIAWCEPRTFGAALERVKNW